MAKSPAPVSREARKAPPRFRSRTTRSGSSGWLVFVSRNTNAARRTTATSNNTMVMVALQPSLSALVKP